MINGRQGEIYWMDMNPVRGSEQTGKRPAVIISGDTLNRAMDIRIACPLTTRIRGNTGRVTIPKTKLNGLKQDSDVTVFHVRAISTERMGKKIGEITRDQLGSIMASLNKVLTY
jgi:mRNA interferase MazF